MQAWIYRWGAPERNDDDDFLMTVLKASWVLIEKISQSVSTNNNESIFDQIVLFQAAREISEHLTGSCRRQLYLTCLVRRRTSVQRVGRKGVTCEDSPQSSISILNCEGRSLGSFQCVSNCLLKLRFICLTIENSLLLFRGPHDHPRTLTYTR